MKTKPPSQGAAASGRSRERRRGAPLDLLAASASSSACASRCDTPPLNDKESVSHGKFAGISPESVQCMGEQVSIEQLSEEACSSLAEDLSYKLRQLIHNVALHARHTKTPRVDVDDVNAVLRLMDTEPVLGPALPQWVPIVEAETLCTTYDPVVDLVGLATQPQALLAIPSPTLSGSWITDSKNASGGSSTISSNLQNYYKKISEALLSGSKQLIRVALHDLSTNTHIGSIIPNIINLTILVLSDPSYEMLHKQALNSLESLFVNPCCCDTDVTLQLQRLFPILISNVLTESPLSEQYLRITASVVTIWPQYAYIGRNTVLEYLSQSVEERLTAQLVDCLTALGRKALVDGLTYHMPLIEAMTINKNEKLYRPLLYEALLNASYEFLKIPNARYDPKIAYIDDCLYNILADAVIPRRIHQILPDKIIEQSPSPKLDFDTSPYSPPKPMKKKSKTKIIKYFPQDKSVNHYYESVFEDSHNQMGLGIFQKYIQINIQGCHQVPTRSRRLDYEMTYPTSFQNGNRYSLDKKVNVIVGNGTLLRFKYRLPNEKRIFPNYNLYTL